MRLGERIVLLMAQYLAFFILTYYLLYFLINIWIAVEMLNNDILPKSLERNGLFEKFTEDPVANK